MKVAAKNFKGTPSEYAKVYEELYDWIEKKEYEPFGNRMEVIKKFPKIVRVNSKSRARSRYQWKNRKRKDRKFF